MLDFGQLQTVMSKLRFMDDTALRTIGLVKLAKLYDAYPVLEDGYKIYCLLPKDMDPAVARQMNLTTAINKIVVLRESAKKLEKIWPTEASTAAPRPAAPAEPVKPAASAAAEPAEAEKGPLGELVEE